MILSAQSFPIDFDSFDAFLRTNVPNADGVVTTDTGLEVIEKVAFVQADIDAVNGYYNALTEQGELEKTTPTTQQVITQKILARIDWGQKLMASFGAQNILAGYTTAQVTQIAQQLAPLQDLVQSGSLETSVAFMNSLTPNSLITQQTITSFVTQIQNYLAAGN